MLFRQEGEHGAVAVSAWWKEPNLRKWRMWAGSLALVVLLTGIGLFLWIRQRGVAEIRVAGPVQIEDSTPAALRNENWPCWRGPGGDARSDRTAGPLSWSDSDAIVWKTEVPGRGHSSPIFWGKS